MLPGGAQGSGPYQWTGNYASNGCVKLSPEDLRGLQSLWNSYPQTLYVRWSAALPTRAAGRTVPPFTGVAEPYARRRGASRWPRG